MMHKKLCLKSTRKIALIQWRPNQFVPEYIAVEETKETKVETEGFCRRTGSQERKACEVGHVFSDGIIHTDSLGKEHTVNGVH